MPTLQSLMANTYVWIAALLMAGLAALGVLIWSKHRVRWLLALGIVAWGAVLLAWFWTRPPQLHPDLPGTFRLPLAFWLFALGAASAVGLTHLVLVGLRPSTAEAAEAEAAFPDLEAAWTEILGAMAVAKVDPARRRWYLLFGPESAQVDALVEASRALPQVVAPMAVEAPIRAVVTADGVLLNITGCTALGARSAGGEARLARLCELIGAIRPELPPVRGVTLVLPIDWAAHAESPVRVAVARDDLQRISDRLLVRAPTYVVFTRLESLRGAPDLLRRMAPEILDLRCGFSLPADRPLQPELLETGLTWLDGWFRSWTLNLMVEDYTDHQSNVGLFLLADAIQRMRRTLQGLLATLFAANPGAEPVQLRGIYLAATGEEPGRRGFAYDLLGRPKARLFSDADLTAWSRGALAADRSDRRLALGLIAAAVAGAGAVWGLAILPRLVVRAREPWVAAAGLAALALAWVAVLALRSRRVAARLRPDPTP